MKKPRALVLITAFILSFAAMAAACPDDETAAAGYPFHNAKRYDKKAAVGEKIACAGCGMEMPVTEKTPFIEHEGKFFYFCTDAEKADFQKKIDESP